MSALYILIHETPLEGRCARKYHGLQGSHILAAGEPGPARPWTNNKSLRRFLRMREEFGNVLGFP